MITLSRCGEKNRLKDSSDNKMFAIVNFIFFGSLKKDAEI